VEFRAVAAGVALLSPGATRALITRFLTAPAPGALLAPVTETGTYALIDAVEGHFSGEDAQLAPARRGDTTERSPTPLWNRYRFALLTPHTPSLSVTPTFRTCDENSNVRKATVLHTTAISAHVTGTSWRTLTYEQVHTGKGTTGVGETRMPSHTGALTGDPRDTEESDHRLQRRAERPDPQPIQVSSVQGCPESTRTALVRGT